MNDSSRWRPYIAGALAGLLAIGSVVVSTKLLGSPKYLGTSTTFVRAAGLIEQSVTQERVAGNAYFQATQLQVDWQFMLVAGIFLGALVASLVDRSFKLEGVPPIWSDRFGNSAFLRAIGALVGGVVAMFGARLAGGCPSGHGLSGLMQLSVSGLLAMVGFFAGGVLVANLVYRSGRSDAQ